MNCLYFTLAFVMAISAERSGWSPAPGTTTKPGNCPASNQKMDCLVVKNLCQSDCECPGYKKCCPQDSGFSCMDPTVIPDHMQTCSENIISVKPANCPKPNGYNCIQCYDQCRSDCECQGQQKCCPEPGCGNSCRNVEN